MSLSYLIIPLMIVITFWALILVEKLMAPWVTKTRKEQHLKVRLNGPDFFNKTGKQKEDFIDYFKKKWKNQVVFMSFFVGLLIFYVLYIVMDFFYNFEQYNTIDSIALFLISVFAFAVIYIMSIGALKSHYYFLDDKVIFGRHWTASQQKNVFTVLAYEDIIRVREFKDSDDISLVYRNWYKPYDPIDWWCFYVETKKGNFIILKEDLVYYSKEKLMKKIRIDIPRKSYIKWHLEYVKKYWK